jgi:hypothetical protein
MNTNQQYHVPVYYVPASTMIQLYQQQNDQQNKQQNDQQNSYQKIIDDIMYNRRYANHTLARRKCKCVVNTIHLIYQLLQTHAHDILHNNYITQQQMTQFALLIVNAINSTKNAIQENTIQSQHICLCKQNKHNNRKHQQEHNAQFYYTTYKAYITIHQFAAYIEHKMPQFIQSK